MTKEDITIEFYFNKAVYKSPITGSETPIDIKEVYKTMDGQRMIKTTIVTSHGVEYDKDELEFII